MTTRFILQELITDTPPFRIHNTKIDTFIYEQDLPIMFLAQYDRLNDGIKAQKPLGDFFHHLNQKVTVAETCAILGIDAHHLKPATHIKFTGTTVMVWDDLPLALHLHFTNTAKDHQVSQYSSTKAIEEQIAHIMLSGSVSVLHKSHDKTLVSMDLSDDEFLISPNTHYTALPNSHALATTQILNHIRHTNPKSMEVLEIALHDAVLTYFTAHFN